MFLFLEKAGIYLTFQSVLMRRAIEMKEKGMKKKMQKTYVTLAFKCKAGFLFDA